MRRPLCVVAVLLCSLALSCGGSTPRSAHPAGGPASSLGSDKARGFIPTGEVRVDIMEVQPPTGRLAALIEKVRAKQASDPDAFVRGIENSQPGEYNPEFGLTRTEFDEFLLESKTLRVAKTGESVLRFAPDGDSRFRLKGGNGLKDVDGIVIDLKRNVVETPYGVADKRSEVIASADQFATGPWNGPEWKLEKGDLSSTATSVSFALGRLVESGRGILYYEAKRGNRRAQDASTLVALEYTL